MRELRSSFCGYSLHSYVTFDAISKVTSRHFPDYEVLLSPSLFPLLSEMCCYLGHNSRTTEKNPECAGGFQ